MTTFGNRIRALADAIGKDEQDIAADLGITKSRMSHYINGRTKVPSEMLQEIVDLYNINPTYLFSDTAPLYSAESKSLNSTERPYIPTAISAGLPLTVDGITEASKISISDEMLGRYKGDTDLFFVRASGDSMDKVFNDGSLLAIKPMQLDQLKNGDIVVYSTNGEYSVKHYHKYGDTLVFKPNSTDTRHEEHEYNVKDDITIHGKVVLYIVEMD